MKQTLLSILMLSLTCCLSAQLNYTIIAATDFDGHVTKGSIETLIEEIRKGKPVRVGYQLDFNKDKVADFDHWVEAEFITILGGHVFTQISPIYIQGPNEAVPQVEIYPVRDQWTALLGTNSKLLNRFIREDLPSTMLNKDGSEMSSEDIELKNMERKKVRTWQVATFWSVPM